MERRTIAPLAASLLALVLVTALSPGLALAETDASSGQEEVAEAPVELVYSVEEPPAVSSPVALLVDADTGYVLFERGADEQRTPASITKILTALVVLENADLDDVVTVEEGDLEHVTPEGTTAGLRAGDALTVRDLLACLLIPSGNDAAYVLARAVGGDWQTFVGMMNDRAAELGCASTHFSDPCGLAEENHHTTARDLVTIFEAAMEYPEFCEISSSRTWDIPATGENPARTLENTNFLLDPESPAYMGDAIVAGKTGFTYDAGKCLIVGARRDGMNLVGVVMGASDEVDEANVTVNFYDMKALLEWGFGAWETGEVVSEGDVVASAEVTLSTDGDAVDVLSADAVFATVPRGTTISDLTVDASWDEPFQAPLERGERLGEATLSLDGRTLGTVAVSPARTMALSIPSFLIWWLTSDATHAIIVVVIAVALFVAIGLLCNSRARARRRREQRLKVSAARAYATSPRSSYDKGGRPRTSPRGSGSARGTGRHMRQ